MNKKVIYFFVEKYYKYPSIKYLSKLFNANIKITNKNKSDYTFDDINFHERKINIFKYIYYKFKLNMTLYLLKKLQMNARSNIGFEINSGSFERIIRAIDNNLTNDNKIIRNYFYFKKRLSLIKLDRPKKIKKVGILSNDYINNELYYGYTLEKILGDNNIKPTRYLDYTSKENKIKLKYFLYKIKKYYKYNISFNMTRNIYRLIRLINKKYDGVIYIKTDNIYDIMFKIIFENICVKKGIPYLVLNFNDQISLDIIKNNIDNFSKIIDISKNNI